MENECIVVTHIDTEHTEIKNRKVDQTILTKTKQIFSHRDTEIPYVDTDNEK